MAGHLTELGDDDLRTALFDALAERFDAKAQQDRSINFVARMPTVLAISRRGNLLTLSQGIGHWLLRGDLKCKDRRERLRTFNVSRATLQSRLMITPDRVEGTPDEILDQIEAMFLELSAAEDEPRRSVSTPPLQEIKSAPPLAQQESRPTPRAAQDRPTVPETMREPRVTSAGSTQDPHPPLPRTTRESRPAPAGPISAKLAPPPPEPFRETTTAPVRETTTRTLRTYQLLFDTAQRELDHARSLPADNRHFLLSAGVFVAFTAEAFLNDLGSRVIPSWSQLARLDPREKAEVLSIELFNDRVDWSARPFQSIAAALGFRRALAHAHAEALSFDQAQTAGRESSEVPRTRRTAWPEHCDVATIQRWIADVRLVIEHFSRGYDSSEVPVDMAIRRA
jgi:hypothetical protein